MNRPTFGPEQQPLGHPATTRWLAQMDAEEATTIAAQVERPSRGEARPTMYLVQRKSDRFYFAAESCGVIGDVWIGNKALAYRFDFQAIAELRILKFPESEKLFVVVPVEG